MTVVELPSPPRLGGLYRAAVLGSVRRFTSRRSSDPAPVPEVELVWTGARVDIDRLAAYDRVCGYRLTDTLPPTYPHVLAFPMALALMTRPDFPLPLLGLVHIANRIEVLAPLSTADLLTLRVRAIDLAPHPRGRQVDVVTSVYLDGACAWREHSTYLRRERRSAAPAGAGDSPEAARHGPPDPGERSERLQHGFGAGGALGEERSDGGKAPPQGPRSPRERSERQHHGAVWRVPAGVGARYARVSGDRNPIHTSRLAARAFGFRRRIAHGMWTAAHCLAALEGRLPDRFTADMRFQRPVSLPARVAFMATPAGTGWAVTLSGTNGGRPHLTGTIHS
jgi:acyl dehydratase